MSPRSPRCAARGQRWLCGLTATLPKNQLEERAEPLDRCQWVGPVGEAGCQNRDRWLEEFLHCAQEKVDRDEARNSMVYMLWINTVLSRLDFGLWLQPASRVSLQHIREGREKVADPPPRSTQKHLNSICVGVLAHRVLTLLWCGHKEGSLRACSVGSSNQLCHTH